MPAGDFAYKIRTRISAVRKMLVQSLQPRMPLQLFLRHCFGSLCFSWQYVLIVSDANIRQQNDIVFAATG